MKKPFYKVLYVQVLAAIVIGVLLGFFFPDIGASMKPLGDGFIKLIKMLIAPVIFCTVVIGIAGMEDMKKVGKVGGIALLYFEIVTTLALLVGLFLVNVLQPGAGMHVDPATLDVNSVSMYATAEKPQSTLDFIFHIIPSSVVGAFAQGDILQVLFFSIIFGFALQSPSVQSVPRGQAGSLRFQKAWPPHRRPSIQKVVSYPVLFPTALVPKFPAEM